MGPETTAMEQDLSRPILAITFSESTMSPGNRSLAIVLALPSKRHKAERYSIARLNLENCFVRRKFPVHGLNKEG